VLSTPTSADHWTHLTQAAIDSFEAPEGRDIIAQGKPRGERGAALGYQCDDYQALTGRHESDCPTFGDTVQLESALKETSINNKNTSE
jgi:hypothetical protein